MLVVSALSLSVVLGACGKDDSGAKKAAKWLKKLGLGTMKLEVGKWAPNQKGLLL